MKNFNFGENLRMIRIYKNVCQEGMASGLKISQASYSRIEASRDLPEVQVINKIAETLGVKPKDLLSASWYAEAVNSISGKTRESVAIISHKGQIAYGLLLAIAAWDSTFGAAAGAELESKDAIVLTGCIFFLVAFFLYYFTVKEAKLDLDDDTLHAIK
ncbi:Transcriptional regulator, contains XRE-family HTH domain [Daejeonella rubra]|uniref:Transcriptional regulator, contains XRE-family HTH domain n=1 Tax=Daejeonella rubra TaxID=990371 RepID=A0A1G9Z1J6_9SPHI|nr:helix-turn-helix transcriptional regulator [Daejeonella rubra]SDN15170.1 Transcriptional regulator, contains XRE-family HTH domain [Daejeonella rubra]